MIQIWDESLGGPRTISEEEYEEGLKLGKENRYVAFVSSCEKVAKKNFMLLSDVANALYLVSRSQIQDLLRWEESYEFIQRLIKNRE